MSKEQELDLAKVIREKIELAGQRGQKEQYHVDSEYGDHGWMDYLKGIRDACWAVDEVIAELKEKHPCEECQEWVCDGCPYSDK